MTVVSGLALGIDSAAHARRARGVRAAPIGVLAGERARRRTRRAAAGCTPRSPSAARSISEMPPGASAHRWCFVARNRIIAALAAATVVVQATERSGSLTTADFAAELGRAVGAVPGQVTTPPLRRHPRADPDGRAARSATPPTCSTCSPTPPAACSPTAAAPPAAALDAARCRRLLAAVEDGRGTLGELAESRRRGPLRPRRPC